MRRHYSEEMKNEIEKMYRENKVPVWKIVNELELGLSAVNCIMSKRGVPTRTKQIPKENILRAVEMYEEGCSVFDICNDAGVATKELYDELDRRNIPRRRNRYQHSAEWLKKENPKHKKIVELYEMGKSKREISVEVDMCYHAVDKVIKLKSKNKSSAYSSDTMGNS